MKRYFPMHEAAHPHKPAQTPYAHKPSCNIIWPIPGMTPGICSCRPHDADCIHNVDYPLWLKGSIIDTLCDCGVTNHHRDCNAYNNYTNEDSWTHRECTCGFSPPTTATLNATESATIHQYAKTADWTTGHQPGCAFLTDPSLPCNCDYNYEDPMDAKYAAEAQTEYRGSNYHPEEHEDPQIVFPETNPENNRYYGIDATKIRYSGNWETRPEWKPPTPPEELHLNLNTGTYKLTLTNPTRTDYDAAIALLTTYRNAL